MSTLIRVLAIDGGGTRGLFPATILRELEKETGRRITDMFDVIVGSATGGIITMALAAEMEVEDIMDIYHKQAGYILPANRFRRWWNPFNLFTSTYPNKNLHQLLQEKFGPTTTLGDVSERFGTDTIFLTGTLDMSPDLAPKEEPSFKVVIYNSAHQQDRHERIVDLAMRTSAAPINLPLYQHYSESGSYANDPTLIALAFCLNRQRGKAPNASYLPDNALGLAADPANIRFLSLGCGSDGSSFVPRKKIGKGRWGLIKWAGRLISLVIHTNMVANQYYMRQFLDEKQYYRLNAYYRAEDAPSVLKDKKLAIDVRDEEQLDAIRSYAEATFAKEKEALRAFLEV